jgi:hypothetical protein
VRKAFVVVILVAVILSFAGCSGFGAKTAKDIEVAIEMIAPEYLAYVDADPKLKDAQKQDRRRQIEALRKVVRAAQN